MKKNKRYKKMERKDGKGDEERVKNIKIKRGREKIGKEMKKE